MIKQHILVLGLNDKDSKTQNITTLDAYKLVFNTLQNQGFNGATITEAQGMYTHDNGHVVFETSLKIEILFSTDAKINSLITTLKQVFNQETIVVITNNIKSEVK